MRNRILQHEPNDPPHKPVEAATKFEASLRRRKSNKKEKRLLLLVARRTLVWFVLVVSAILVVHESIYFMVLNRLDALPNHRALREKVAATATTVSNDPTDSIRIGIASLHRGFKFAGYLGTWLDGNKASYAHKHGYVYFNQNDFHSSQMEALSAWQSVYHRRIKFDKLRFLLHLLTSVPKLQYVLWMDGDTIVANADVRLEDRIHEFQQLLPNFLFVWAKDSQPNTGVLLLRNCVESRNLLQTSLHTWNSNQTFMDQASFSQTVVANSTYSSRQLLLTSESSRRLQSRVRGLAQWRFQKGDWILHLPNHNRIEFLLSLTKWLPSVEAS